MSNEEMLAELKKAGITTSTGGQMPIETAQAFIDTTFAQNEFLKLITTISMDSATYRLDTLGIDSRLMRKATEGVAPTDIKSVTIGNRTLAVQEVILPYDISFSFLENNIEKDKAEDSINKAFATQFANDLLDLDVNGDTASSDPFISIIDGWLKRASVDGSVHPVTIAGGDTVQTTMGAMIAAMPNKWKADVTKLVFLLAPDQELSYRNLISQKNTALGDKYLVEGRRAQYVGVDVYPLPYMPGSTTPQILLTPYKNLCTGIGRNIRVGKFINERARNLEYTITARVDANYAISDAVVIAKKA